MPNLKDALEKQSKLAAAPTVGNLHPDARLQAIARQQPETALPYGIVDPDYARVYTQARIIAWQYGYACVMHGSFTRDLDLLLTPWEERASNNHDQILRLIALACGLRFRDGKDGSDSTIDWTNKAHGRKACSLYFPTTFDRRWVDISFTPCAAIAAKEVTL